MNKHRNSNIALSEKSDNNFFFYNIAMLALLYCCDVWGYQTSDVIEHVHFFFLSSFNLKGHGHDLGKKKKTYFDDMIEFDTYKI